jgi:transcriptional regulator with XRE-family HTH domain
MAEKQTAKTARLEQAQMVRTIGARMRQARELCNLSQSAAARRLGYANSSKLSKVEGATDTNSVPLWLILRAAQVYEVSVDFLFGVSEDWETGARMTQERETSSWLFETWEKARRRDMETLRRLHDRMGTLNDTVVSMLSASADVASALDRFAAINPQFEDMRAGSRLAATIERAAGAAVNAQTRLNKFKLECKMAAADTSQLSLVL